MSDLVSLKTWADRDGIPHRTALEWAKLKKIPAKKKRHTVTVTREEEVFGYMIDPEIDGKKVKEELLAKRRGKE